MRFFKFTKARNKIKEEIFLDQYLTVEGIIIYVDK